MTLDQLHAFVAVAEQRQLTEAAKRLGLSQPTLSRQILALEKELAIKLLVRTPRGVALSEAGERFLAHAREALEALRAGTTELDELTRKPRGPVALGTLGTVGAYLLPPLVKTFIEQNPSVRIRIAEGLADSLEERVADGDLDLAILPLPLRRMDLVAQKLWEEPFVLIAPRGHKLGQAKRPVVLSSVVEEPFIVIPGVVSTAALRAAAESRGREAHVVVEVDNPEALRRLVERGLGLALIPQVMTLERRTAAFDVIEVQNAPRRTVAIIHRGERSLTAAARALKRFLVEQLRRD